MTADFLSFLSKASTIGILLGYVFALWVALTVWTWFDMANRTSNMWYRLGAVTLVALGFLPGFAIYLILRPSQTKEEFQLHFLEERVFESQSRSAFCYRCGEMVENEFAFCTNCGASLKKACESCGQQINFSWKVCPFCAHVQKERQASSQLPIFSESVGGGSRAESFFNFIKSLRLVPRKQGGKKRGRPRKEKPEPQVKRPRGRPRKTPAET